jgi:hypothetical protein
VAIRTRNGDVLFGKASQDWRPAHALAQQLCEVAGLPLDELTKGLFSKVGWNERGASRL